MQLPACTPRSRGTSPAGWSAGPGRVRLRRPVPCTCSIYAARYTTHAARCPPPACARLSARVPLSSFTLPHSSQVYTDEQTLGLIRTYVKSGALIAASISSSGEVKQATGLVAGHAYSLLDAKRFKEVPPPQHPFLHPSSTRFTPPAPLTPPATPTPSHILVFTHSITHTLTHPHIPPSQPLSRKPLQLFAPIATLAFPSGASHPLTPLHTLTQGLADPAPQPVGQLRVEGAYLPHGMHSTTPLLACVSKAYTACARALLRVQCTCIP